MTIKVSHKKAVCFIFWLATVLWAGTTSAQPVPYPFVLTPTYGVGTCINGTPNGFTGSDSILFTAPETGTFTVANFSGDGFWAFVDPGTYDSNVRIIDQLVASNYSGDTKISLSSGESALLVGFFNGGYGSIPGCEADGSSDTFAGDVVSTAPDRPVPVMPVWLLALLAGLMSLLAVRKLR